MLPLFIRDMTPSQVTREVLLWQCLSSWIVSEQHGRAIDCVATPDGAVHVLVTPLAIHTYRAPDYSTYDRTDLSDYLAVLRAFDSRVQLHVLRYVCCSVLQCVAERCSVLQCMLHCK